MSLSTGLLSLSSRSHLRTLDWALWLSGLAISLMFLFVTVGGWIAGLAGLDAETVNIFKRLGSPDQSHPLGTDELGRDLLARLIQGGQVSIAIGLTGALGSAIIGSIIGLLAGYLGGRTDMILMRLTDAILALPLLPVLIVLAALDLNKIGIPAELANNPNLSIYKLIVLVTLFGWTTVARLVRATVLSLKTREFVIAARALGASNMSIALRHILPNALTPVIIATTLSIGNVILTESVLSFLGLGIHPPMPSWGNMLTNAQETAWESPQLAFYPGFLIFITVVSFNFFGDSLQERFDPKTD